MQPRQILFICDGPLALNTGAHQRLTHLLKALGSVGEVTFVYPIKDAQIGPDLEALIPLCKSVVTFPVESLTVTGDLRLPRPVFWLLHKLRYLHPVSPVYMQYRRSAEANAVVAKICSQPFDLVWGARLSAIQILPASLKTRVIIDLDDLEHRSLRWQLRMAKVHHMTLLYWLEFFKLRRLELSLHSYPYEFCVCSEIDKKVLGANSRVWVVPNGADVPVPVPVPNNEKREPILLFVGSMAYSPNSDAVTFFAQSILPLIRHQVPDVQFLIVGRDPPPSVQQLHDGKSVIVTGTVPDVGEYLRRAVASVVPIRWGGGTRIKILEAMAYRKPVVSTSVGAEGLDVHPGKHLLIADSPVAFAEACVRLLKDESLRQRLSEAGFQLIVDRYQWTMIERKVQEIVQGDSGLLAQAV